MQVFSSYFSCLKFISVVIFCAHNVVIGSLDTGNLTAESGITSTTKDLESSTTRVHTTIVTSNTTEDVNKINLTTTPISITLRSLANEDTTISSSEKPTTHTPLAVSETTITTTPITSTVTENTVTTTAKTTATTPNNNVTNETTLAPSTNATTFQPSTNATTFEPFTNPTTIAPPSSEGTTNSTTFTPTSTDNTTPSTFTSSTTGSSTIPTTIITSTSYSTTSATTEYAPTTEEPCITSPDIDARVTERFKTEVTLNITTLSNTTVCPIEMNIVCIAPNENNTQWSWVVQLVNVTVELNGINSVNTTIENLSEFTNYTCYIATTDYSTNISLVFQTKQEVTSSPIDLIITQETSSSFNVTWGEPQKIPSFLIAYLVTITRKDVASEGHIWNNCSQTHPFIRNVTDTYILFNQSLPDFVYSVTVVAISNVGDSEAANHTVKTPSAAANPPENFSANAVESDFGQNIEFGLNYTWNIPCNTNGPVNSFEVKLYGFYLYNESRHNDSRTSVISVNKNETMYFSNFTDIWAATNYTLEIYLIGEMQGIPYKYYFTTKDNYPSAPKFNDPIINADDFTVFWEEPDNYPGDITYYVLQIMGLGLNWEPSQYCRVNSSKYDITRNVNDTKYFNDMVVPDANYVMYLSAVTSRGQGNAVNLTITSDMKRPGNIFITRTVSNGSNSEEYSNYVNITFMPGCFNGKFESYLVDFVGTRQGREDHTDNKEIRDQYIHEANFNLRPEYSYTANVTVRNEQYATFNTTDYIAPAGVPIINNSVANAVQINSEGTHATVTFRRSSFDESQGKLRYLAIIVSSANVTGGSFTQWKDNSQWPIPDGGDTGIYYQATPKFWDDPLSDSIDPIQYVLGTDTTCNGKNYCNKPLEPSTQYFIFVRFFNDNFYRNSMPVTFVTDKLSRIGMIVGILCALLFLVAGSFTLFILRRRGCIKGKPNENNGYREPLEDSSAALLSNSDDMLMIPPQCRRKKKEVPKTEIPKNRFVQYCKSLEQNPADLTAQWSELEKQSQIIYDDLPHRFAMLPENRRKNRYTNILPFDHSRVKLNMDEDDEISSDYINASYIKGFSGQNEYIACQGPLSGTCRDFWKMVLQENVTIIVMVSRFIESNKDKCYRYFPNNRETMTIIGEDIEVRCSMELHFGFYCIRTLQVKKELTQITVTHMQFLEWPDFGVPAGTETMLNFIHQFRERWTNEGGMAVVHCSAGVGRTGTLIATDILLRTIAADKKIDVFNTVLELRRQRKTMVQAEKQYMYIYQLIRSIIEFPIVDEQENDEHLYENIGRQNGIVESTL